MHRLLQPGRRGTARPSHHEGGVRATRTEWRTQLKWHIGFNDTSWAGHPHFMAASRNALVVEVQRDAALSLHRFTHFAMACQWELFIGGEAADYAQQVAWVVFDEVDRLEHELSRFIAHSDVFRLNALEPGQSLRVGIAMLECLRLARTVYEQTGGAFDVTVGNLVDKWRSDEAPRTTPVKKRIEERPKRQPRSGMELLAMDETEFTLGWRQTRTRKSSAPNKPSIDLGGIGKGYAIDCAAKLLRDWSVSVALLHSGQSTALAIGAPPAQEGWPLALRDPRDLHGVLNGVHLRDGALSGSGTLLSKPHIIDPRTGASAHRKLATWAATQSAARSDALSTAFMVMTVEEVEAYCREHEDVVGLLLVGDPTEPSLLQFGEVEGLSLSHGASMHRSFSKEQR